MAINSTPRQGLSGDSRRRPSGNLNRIGGQDKKPAANPRRAEPPRKTVRQPGSPGPRTPRLARVRGSRWFTAILMVMITLAGCLFLAIFILQSASDLFGLNQQDKQIEVVVPPKSTLPSIAALLYDKGVISQPFTFSVYAGLKVEDSDILPGSYIFNENFSYDQIVDALKTGNTKKEEVVVRFIEGSTLYEIAQKLEESKVCSADEFLQYMEKGDIDYDFMNQVPTNALRFRRLEGYAFPDTYEFYVGMEVPLVANKFLSNLNKKITEEMRAKMRDMNLTLDQTLILASIIQKEADDNIENRTVSQVFHNRLSSSESFPNLQSDVTIYYVEHFIKPFLERRDQPLYDAYNTYECEGLPAGAICNPGLDAIMAVLEPDGSDFYYFVTDTEGTYYYAKTAQQHYANVVKAEKVGGDKVHGTDTIDNG